MENEILYHSGKVKGKRAWRS